MKVKLLESQKKLCYIKIANNSSVSHNFKAPRQVAKFDNSIQEFLLCTAEPMEAHLTDYSSLISH